MIERDMVTITHTTYAEYLRAITDNVVLRKENEELRKAIKMMEKTIAALESEIGEYTRTTVRLNKRDKEQAIEIEKQRNYIIVLESEKRDDRR